MRAGRPVIIYRITYDDGEEVTAASHTAWAQSALIHLRLTRLRRARTTGGRGPAHAPCTEGSRGGARGGSAVRPAVPEHAEKSIGWQASPCLRAKV